MPAPFSAQRRHVLAGIIAALLVHPAMATERNTTQHEIAIVAGAFFPEVTFAQPGDRLIFVNFDETPRQIYKSKPGFVSPRLSQNESWSVVISSKMQGDFFGRSQRLTSDQTQALDSGDLVGDTLADSAQDGRIMRGGISFEQR
ncbi:MAG: hypothetical protein ACO3R6_09585 [Lutimaribacter sp.]|jgi:hypothetical protein